MYTTVNLFDESKSRTEARKASGKCKLPLSMLEQHFPPYHFQSVSGTCRHQKGEQENQD